MMRYSAVEIAAALGKPRPTDEQVAVIEAPLRPLLVVAGAGSGKTETMASRVVWLVANGIVEPDQVLGLTFTRKAAGQLAERIAARLRALRAGGLWTPSVDADGTPGLADIPTVQTYHSYAGRLVSEHGMLLGIEPDVRLLSEAAAWQYASAAVQAYDGPMEEVGWAESTITAAVVGIAGELAEHLVTTTQMSTYLREVVTHLGGVGDKLGTPGTSIRSDLAQRLQLMPIVEAYLRLKHERGAVDFADQMAIAAHLAERFPRLGESERGRFRAVLLDEFQDTSEAQLRLLRALHVCQGEPVPVTAVGDPHQSIYGWRGASATTLTAYVESFADDIGPAQVLPLSTSWRNDVAILDAANAVSAPLRAASTVDVEELRARPGAGAGTVDAAFLETDLEEADQVAGWIAARWFTGSEPPSAAVLCRKRSLFTPMMDALAAQGIPFEVVGIGGLLMTPEVCDLVSLLWVVQDPTRGDRLMRLLTGPAVRLGAADLDGLGAWSRELLRRTTPQVGRAEADIAAQTKDRASIIEAIDELPAADWIGTRGESIGPVARSRLQWLSTVVRRLRGLTGLPLAELAGEAERALGLDIEVLARGDVDHGHETGRVHLDAFAEVAAGFSASADRPTLGGFLAWLDAAEDEERGLETRELESQGGAVQILTVHAAKGLEWDIVAVPGMVEGTFPAHQGLGAYWHPDLEGWSLGKAGTPDAPDTWSINVRGWTGGAEGLPFDLRGDAAGLPVFAWAQADNAKTLNQLAAQFISANGDYALQEERRLGYVALTRAREHLLVTGSIWGAGKTPKLPSRLLSGLVASGIARATSWADLPEGPKPDNPRADRDQSMVWPGDPLAVRREHLQAGHDAVVAAMETRAARDGRRESPAEAASETSGGALHPAAGPDSTQLGADHPLAAQARLLLRERAAQRTSGEVQVALPRHLSTSAVVSYSSDPVAFAEALRRPMPSPPAFVARRGTAFHAWVEQHFAQAALVDITELPGAADDDGSSDLDLQTMKDHFLASEWAGQAPEAIEVAVETWIGGMSIRGRIDAVFRRPDGRFVVVDWKTGAVPAGERAAHRALQLAAYRVAFARLHGIDPDQVDAAFYYAATGETVWPPLATEAELDALLAAIPPAAP